MNHRYTDASMHKYIYSSLVAPLFRRGSWKSREIAQSSFRNKRSAAPHTHTHTQSIVREGNKDHCWIIHPCWRFDSLLTQTTLPLTSTLFCIDVTALTKMTGTKQRVSYFYHPTCVSCCCRVFCHWIDPLSRAADDCCRGRW